MPQERLLDLIARFVSQTKFDEIPKEELYWADKALIDFFSVAYPGARMPVVLNVLSYLQDASRLGTGKCVLIGTDETSDAVSAALFNGTVAHALDYDDVSWTTIGHPTVSVAPAALSVVQEMRLGGRELLHAYIVGVEAMHQLARWVMPMLSERGWHTTPALGAIGAAAAACAAYGLDTRTTANALAIAVSRCGGVRSNFGTQTKALHAGMSAQVGVESAKLAMHGINGNPAAIEAPDGYAQCFAGVENREFKFDLGQVWDLKENGLVFKQYPCCSGSHPTNDVWGEFVAEHNIHEEDIEHIHAGVSLLGPRELNCHDPQDAVAAKFSLEFAIAARVLYGPLEIGTFTDEKVQNPKLRALMKKVRMEVDPRLAELGFIGTAPVRLDVHLKDGSHIRLENDLAVGNPQKPFSDEVRKRKFDSCLKAADLQPRADAIWALISALPELNEEQVLKLGLRN